MKVSEILKSVKDCERLRDILMKNEDLMSEDKQIFVIYCGIIAAAF